VGLDFKIFTTGFISAKYLGWISGWVMVLPNGILAFYYGWRGQPETVYASQSAMRMFPFPLCVGIYAMFHTLVVPAVLSNGMIILLGATFVHLVLRRRFGAAARARRAGCWWRPMACSCNRDC